MEKRVLNILLALALVAFLGSCNNKPAENKQEEEIADVHEEGMDHEETADKTQEDSTSDEAIVTAEDFKNISDQVAKSLTNAYLDLKDALVESSPEKSKEAASKMLAALEGADATTAVKGIREDAEHIMDTDELEHIREHFDLISENLYVMVKSKDIGLTLYKQYCPMAFNNEGAFWLSANEEIRNPYFGDKMLKCGSVQETITVE